MMMTFVRVIQNKHRTRHCVMIIIMILSSMIIIVIIIVIISSMIVIKPQTYPDHHLHQIQFEGSKSFSDSHKMSQM